MLLSVCVFNIRDTDRSALRELPGHYLQRCSTGIKQQLGPKESSRAASQVFILISIFLCLISRIQLHFSRSHFLSSTCILLLLKIFFSCWFTLSYLSLSVTTALISLVHGTNYSRLHLRTAHHPSKSPILIHFIQPTNAPNLLYLIHSHTCQS